VRRMLPAKLAILASLKPVRHLLFIFERGVISILAYRTFESY